MECLVYFLAEDPIYIGACVYADLAHSFWHEIAFNQLRPRFRHQVSVDTKPKGWFQADQAANPAAKCNFSDSFLQDPNSNTTFLSAFRLEMLTALTSGACCCDVRSLWRLNKIEPDTEDEKSPLV